MEADNTMHCDDCNKNVNMDVGFGVACDKRGCELCAACIRKRMKLGKWDGMYAPQAGERSFYARTTNKETP
jgi:hypothetical protein